MGRVGVLVRTPVTQMTQDHGAYSPIPHTVRVLPQRSGVICSPGPGPEMLFLLVANGAGIDEFPDILLHCWPPKPLPQTIRHPAHSNVAGQPRCMGPLQDLCFDWVRHKEVSGAGAWSRLTGGRPPDPLLDSPGDRRHETWRRENVLRGPPRTLVLLPRELPRQGVCLAVARPWAVRWKGGCPGHLCHTMTFPVLPACVTGLP